MDMTHLERTNSLFMQTFLSTKETLVKANSYNVHLALSLQDAFDHEDEAFVLYSQVFGQLNGNTDYRAEELWHCKSGRILQDDWIDLTEDHYNELCMVTVINEGKMHIP